MARPVCISMASAPRHSGRAFCIDRTGCSGHGRGVKVREVLQRLHQEGWVLRRQKGSHRQFFNPSFPDLRVTVSGHPHLDIPKGTLNSIFKQAGWK